MPITENRIRELTAEHDNNPDRNNRTFYVAYMRIVLENEGVSLAVWDNEYTDTMRSKAFKKAKDAVQRAVKA